MKDESPVCSTGCVEYRLGCLRDSRNYAECIPLEECQKSHLISIIFSSIVGAVFLFCCIGCIVSAVRGRNQSSSAVDDSAFERN